MSDVDPRPIFVVAPSRSGTSAVTRVVNLLGAPTCVDDDLYMAPDNPDGHWESRTVIAFDERLLARFGGTWGLPPESLPWRDDPEAPALLAAAAEEFLAVHPEPGWVCKDPRLCLTLPFWLEALDVDPVFVLALRHPEEIVRSLAADGVPVAHALAIWERYVVTALRHLEGREVVTVRLDGLVRDPLTATRELGQALEAAGTAAREELAEVAAEAVRPGNRHHVADERLAREMNGQQRELWALLDALPQVPSPFPAVAPEESQATVELLRALSGAAWWQDQARHIRDRLTGLLSDGT